MQGREGKRYSHNQLLQAWLYQHYVSKRCHPFGASDSTTITLAVWTAMFATGIRSLTGDGLTSQTVTFSALLGHGTKLCCWHSRQSWWRLERGFYRWNRYTTESTDSWNQFVLALALATDRKPPLTTFLKLRY
jgi:hypothetical protein